MFEYRKYLTIMKQKLPGTKIPAHFAAASVTEKKKVLWHWHQSVVVIDVDDFRGAGGRHFGAFQRADVPEELGDVLLSDAGQQVGHHHLGAWSNHAWLTKWIAGDEKGVIFLASISVLSDRIQQLTKKTPPL